MPVAKMGAALVLAAPMAVAAAAAPSCVNVVGLQRSGPDEIESLNAQIEQTAE